MESGQGREYDDPSVSRGSGINSTCRRWHDQVKQQVIAKPIYAMPCQTWKLPENTPVASQASMSLLGVTCRGYLPQLCL